MNGRIVVIMVLLVILIGCDKSNQRVVDSSDWEASYGGHGNTEIYDIYQSEDGGYMAVGSQKSSLWVTKINQTGQLEWEKTFGKEGRKSKAYSIIKTNDQGYLVAGAITSIINGMWDFYVVKLDQLGNKKWHKQLGGGNNDFAYSAVQSRDGGYLIVGCADEADIGQQGWLFKLDVKGELQWHERFGGRKNDCLKSIIKTKDTGYIAGGFSNSKDAATQTETIPVPLNMSIFQGRSITVNRPDFDIWLVKFDENGQSLWQKLIGNEADVFAQTFQPTSDEGFLIGGQYSSKGTDRDNYVAKLDKQGNMLWDNITGGSSTDGVFSIQETEDGSALVAANLRLSGGDVLLMKFDSKGNKQWTKELGKDSHGCQANAIRLTKDKGFIVAGKKLGENKNDSYPSSVRYAWIRKFPSLSAHPVVNKKEKTNEN